MGIVLAFFGVLIASFGFWMLVEHIQERRAIRKANLAFLALMDALEGDAQALINGVQDRLFADLPWMEENGNTLSKKYATVFEALWAQKYPDDKDGVPTR